MMYPPKLAQKLLKWFAGKADLEDIQGDLDEVYGVNLEQSGKWKADLKYWGQVLSLLFSYGLKKRKSKTAYSSYYHKNSMTMLRNYLKIAYRNLKKQKAFTLINIVGLAMGMSIALLALAMYVDLTYFDKHHEDAENIYRITTTIKESGDINKYASAPPALTYQLDNQVGQIYKSVHINDYLFPIIEHNENLIETTGYFTEPSFFEVFNFPIETGDASSLLEPGTTIITKELATKLYEEEDAIDKVLQTKKWGQLRVAGVLKKFPKHTHLAFDLLVGFPTSDKFNANFRSSEWTNFSSNYYYFAVHDSEKDQVISQINQLGKNGQTDFEKEGEIALYDLQPLLDVTACEMIDDGLGIQFDGPTMLLFFGISLLILIPACFNYTNMSIAIALKRSKEVGIRKVMGSHRKQVIAQFLTETIIICLLALIFSSYLFYLIKGQYLSMLIGADSLSLAITPKVVIAFILFAIATGLLTGIGPALYFAKISPIQALRSSSADQKVSISGIRKGLLVFQFALTLMFMIVIGVILKQYLETRSFEYAFQIDKTFVIPTKNQDVDLIRNGFKSQQGVEDISFSSTIPGTPLSKNRYVYYEDLQDSMRTREIFIDPSFVNHMNLSIQWGETLTDDEYQIEQVLVNEALMKKQRLLGSDQDSLILQLEGSKAQIIGIIADYNHEPLNQRIEPMIIRKDQNKVHYAIATLSSNDLSASYSQLETTWERLFPNTVFEAFVLKEEIDKAYDYFQSGLKIFGFLAVLAISISCLGLLGMVIYATENRIKEVAIRKILGANQYSLFGTLASLFVKLWGIALLIAVPLAYLFCDNFVVSLYNKFSAGVGFTEIALSVLVTLSLGVMAIFWQVRKIIRINPATNLRSE